MENQVLRDQIVGDLITDYEFASPLRRAAAFLIDGFLVILILSLTILHPNTFSGIINIQAVIVVIALILYEGIFAYYCSSTLGKFLMGIKIVDHHTHKKPSLLKCFIRPWAKLLFGLWIINSEFIYIILLLLSAFNYLKMATDDEYRAIHDKIAGTEALKIIR